VARIATLITVMAAAISVRDQLAPRTRTSADASAAPHRAPSPCSRSCPSITATTTRTLLIIPSPGRSPPGRIHRHRRARADRPVHPSGRVGPLT
jgi:hypothetical protein